MRLRRIKYLVTLLLILSAFAATIAQSNIFTPVQSAPTVTPSPTHARPGTLITVTLSGFSASDTSCSVSGTPVSNPSSCSLSGGAGSFTFTVASVGAGTYTITVTGNPTSDSGQASFNVDNFGLVLTPTSGPSGTEVKFTLTGVPTTDTSCSVSSPTNPSVITSAACVVSSGSGNGTFIAGPVPPDNYVIEITACPGNNGCAPSIGDFAQQEFTVTTGPVIKLSPATGQPGAHIIVNGTGFSPADQSCTISAVGLDSNGHSPILSGTAACAVHAGSGVVNGSFTIGNVLPGQYVIEVTGCTGNNGCFPSSGDFAQAVLNVVSGPKISLSPATGQPGVHVLVNGTGFLSTDTSCTVSAVGLDSNGHTPILSGTAGCVVHVGSGVVNGSFTIGNVLPGQYVIEVTGCGGNNGCAPSAGDFAQALLNVVSGPKISLSPATGQPGAHILVNGTGFLPTDTSCTVSAVGLDSNGHTPILSGTAGCVVHVGSGIVNGSFTIGNVLPGQYVIEVTGCAGNNGCFPSSGDFAQALLNVVTGPKIALSPATGQPGAHILVNGTGFLPTDTSCTISAVGLDSNGHTPVLGGTAACVMRVGTGIVNGSFTIGNVLPGQYVIEVTACAGNNGCFPSSGDFAQAVLNVVSGPKISLSPATGQPGAHILVNGTGFLPTDTSCTISAVGLDSNGHTPVLGGTAACAIHVGSGVVNGSFTIGNVLPGQYVIEVTGCAGNNGCFPSSGDFAQAVLNVVKGPAIFLSPATGKPGTHVLVNGTGFLPTDTSCTVSAVGLDANGHTPVLGGTAACVMRVGTGIVNGSFTIGNVLPGQYVIEVTGCAGNNGCFPSSGDFAQAVLDVVSGPGITLTPAAARTGAHITVNGTGFLPTDTSCSVAGIPTSLEVIVPGTGACVIRAGTGVVNASFIVSNVQPGQYVIEITACLGNNGCAPSAGDFAQAVLFVVSGPSIALSPATDAPGAHVLVNGTGFLPSDTTCILVSGSSNLVNPILAGTAACVIHEGTGMVNASFTVGNVPPGQYVIEIDSSSAIITTVTTTLTGTTTTFTTSSSASTTTTFTSTTNLQIDTAQAILNVAGGPKIGLSPATGQPGAHILVNGTGFLPTDTSCTVSAVGLDANGHSPILGGTAGCVIRVGSGIVNASFTIGNVLPGQYVIEVTGCSGNNGCFPSAGDFAQAVLNVVSGPKITLSPATGQPGVHVLVNGTGFLPTDTSCTIAAVGLDANGHSPILGGTAGCVIRAGSGLVNGSFTIGNVLPGQYVIEITGCLGNNGCAPSAGDFAQALLNVVSGPAIKLSPASARTGAHILVNGTGFLPTDTSCTITAVGLDSNGHTPILAGTAACVVRVGSGIVNGSFSIGNVLPGQYVIEVTGCLGNNGCFPSSGDFAQAVLDVVSGPSIKLSPATGQPGAHILVNGTGFLPTDTSCTITAVGLDSNGHTPILAGTAACAITAGSGLVNGSFIIGNVLPGQYVIEITGCGGNNGCLPSAGDFAQAVLNVVKGPAIKLSPGSARTGAHILVNGTGFLPTDTSCTISAVGLDSNGHTPILAGTAGCAISVGSGLVNGSFTIGNVLPGQYVIEITGCGGNNGCLPSAGDFAQAVLDVVSGPSIKLSPATGQPGAHILVNGTGFLPTDTSCTVFAIGLDANGHSPLLAGTAGCAISSGSGLVNASFTIGNVLPGQYVIEVTACGGNNGCLPSVGDFAQAVLNVVRGPSIKLSPATGQPGAHILVNGTGFLPTDQSCSLSGVGLDANGHSPILSGTAACAISVGSGLVNASFTIGNVLPGQYVIEITGCLGNNGCTPSIGDFAQAVLNVVSGPSIKLSPGTGQPGVHVSVNGTGFLPTDTSCTLSAVGLDANGHSPILGGTAGCVIRVGSGVVNASFTIGNVLPGQYVIEITGCLGNNGCLPSSGDFAQALLNVVSGPEIKLSPGTGSPGFDILVNGTGFLPTDTSCSISAVGLDANGHSPIFGGSASCVVRVGSGVVNGSFTIGNVLPGQYVIEITGCLGNNGCTPSVGDFAQANLKVVGGPRLTLNPGTGMIGQEILVNGTGFLPTDQSCSVSSPSTPNPILPGSSGCAIAVGTGLVNASFVIGGTAPGQYVIEITGCLSNNGCAPSAGDFAQAVLNVKAGASEIDLFPTNATTGATVVVRAYGLSPSDTGCIILAYSGDITPVHQDNTLITSPTCSIVSTQTAQGTFVVGPYATEDIHWNVTVKGTPANDLLSSSGLPIGAPFGVTAQITVVPTSGSVNSVFTYTGTGFESDAKTCSATVIPSFTNASKVSTVEPSCAIDPFGQVSGSVVVPRTAIAGTYAIEVGDSTGSNASAVFTVGTPSALVVLNPSSVEQGQAVGVAGFGFNSQDAFCTISSASGSALFDLTHPVTCLVGSGYVSGAFNVAPNAPGGYYLITVIGCSVAPSVQTTSTPPTCPAGDSLDFASNFLGVTLATTVTTFSTTTSSATTTTSLSTTTTSVATSFSFSSTTYSTTGIFFTTYTHYTVNTVSGQTTTVVTQTSSTTNTQTTVTFSTTTQFTTVPCGPLPCGFQTQPTPFNPAPGIDSTGLLAALLLLIPMLLRRLFT